VQRELGRLAQAGLLRKSIKAGRAYYQANRDCPIFDEIRSLVLKTVGMVAVLQQALTSLTDIQIAFVFGSVARDEAGPVSDIDLVVIGPVTLREVVRTVAPASMQLQREVNPVVFRPQEFRKRAASSDHFVSELLQSQKLFVVGTQDDLEAMAR